MENNDQLENTQENTPESIFTKDDFSLQGYDKHIRQARNAIFAAAIILAINLVVLVYSIPSTYEYLWIDIAIWGAFILGFLALGFWERRNLTLRSSAH